MADTIRFDDKVVVVTGAGNGLGRTYALQLAQRGAKVVVNDLGGSTDGKGDDRSAASRVVEEIRAAGGEATANFDSVATQAGGANIIKTALDAYGRVDAVIANAGILRDRSFSKLSQEELDIILDVHLRGTMFTVQPAFNWMRENGGGNIVMTASPSGLFGAFGQANYCAAKLGIVGMMRVMAIEGAKAGIKVNALAPTAATRLTATAGMSGEATEPKTPEEDPMSTGRVSPLVLALAHQSCPASGEIFNAGCGWISRAVVAVNEGVLLDDFSPEGVAAQWDAIRDPSRLTVPVDATDYWRMIQAKTGATG
ncbi:NAD(P)-dependent dehydrogenase (short-subunit alcohol dehydrogenase family) [Caulobacter rhizosphaerae]|jgi:NAD(P)-dependent dehydrogenase (short-subunit alcohol dehydrogenase family)|uniref:NAD(P)-dependent dehydrogenase (Short-subunit alcohol dehydrogenase family) n=1 Tax=Caulobacter rhizosphaerae TaxID=2010972 RepID=A0ABU1N6K6_9CAUL|nr:SDR family NAD(P)-dependent oxidoreductase [Caulobacter rhizosphaerae]MDR6534092.1 NAD(P)-dependent dehydrogenase (short-subunit alcohol dehydrogenase family) [Caulobacter rhizosphaerae]